MTGKIEEQSLAKVTPITEGEAGRQSQRNNIVSNNYSSSTQINDDDIIIIKKDVYEHLSALYKRGADLLAQNGMLKVVE